MNLTLIAFNGDLMCFTHVLLNALDMHDKGHTVTIVLEGASVGLLPQLTRPSCPAHGLYQNVKILGMIRAVCRACAVKMNALESAESEGLPIDGQMAGHAPIEPYLARGDQVITF